MTTASNPHAPEGSVARAGDCLLLDRSSNSDFHTSHEETAMRHHPNPESDSDSPVIASVPVLAAPHRSGQLLAVLAERYGSSVSHSVRHPCAACASLGIFDNDRACPTRCRRTPRTARRSVFPVMRISASISSCERLSQPGIVFVGTLCRYQSDRPYFNAPLPCQYESCSWVAHTLRIRRSPGPRRKEPWWRISGI